jgi:hypothetical protein
MTPTFPFWFKQRQARAEAVAENYYRVTGPNLREAYVGIRQVDNRWQAFLRFTQDGPDAATTEPRFSTPQDAWDAAFELHRNGVVL